MKQNDKRLQKLQNKILKKYNELLLEVRTGLKLFGSKYNLSETDKEEWIKSTVNKKIAEYASVDLNLDEEDFQHLGFTDDGNFDIQQFNSVYVK